MSIDQNHPLYVDFLSDWVTMRDSYRGERIIKTKRFDYLPATPGMMLDGAEKPNTKGWFAYDAYIKRAVYHDFVRDAVEALVGMLHDKPPVIELPSSMEQYRERASNKGEDLETLLRRVNEQQLVTGRLGLLADMPEMPDPANPLPYLALYDAEAIINWDDETTNEAKPSNLNLVVLDESGYQRHTIFEWEYKRRHRVLMLGDPQANEREGTAIYSAGLFEELNSWSAGLMRTPSIRGVTLQKIPFVFINSKDIVAQPDDPPLIGLAKLALAIYRGEADFRQNLFMQGQDTLVVIGSTPEEETRVGAGARINVQQGGDAKYIGVSSQGLAEQRMALEADKAVAATKGAQLLDSSKQKESGEALHLRLAAKTATLNQIALTGAAGLERSLRIVAEWMGADPMQVIVTPNLDFADMPLDGATLVEYMTARGMGAPMSLKSIHTLMRKRELTEFTFEEEMEEIAEENATLGLGDGSEEADGGAGSPV